MSVTWHPYGRKGKLTETPRTTTLVVVSGAVNAAAVVVVVVVVVVIESGTFEDEEFKDELKDEIEEDEEGGDDGNDENDETVGIGEFTPERGREITFVFKFEFEFEGVFFIMKDNGLWVIFVCDRSNNTCDGLGGVHVRLLKKFEFEFELIVIVLFTVVSVLFCACSAGVESLGNTEDVELI